METVTEKKAYYNGKVQAEGVYISTKLDKCFLCSVTCWDLHHYLSTAATVLASKLVGLSLRCWRAQQEGSMKLTSSMGFALCICASAVWFGHTYKLTHTGVASISKAHKDMGSRMPLSF